MAGRGGYMQPENPAPVSGPGALSQRTDGGATEGMQKPTKPQTQPARYMPGLGYGEGGKNYQNQTAAPLAGNDIPVTPLTAPTMRPNEPITHGVDVGAGAGSGAMGNMPNTTPHPAAVMYRLAQNDPSGDSELLYRMLADKGF